MLLYAKCKSCSERIEGKYLVKDRIGFAQDYGEDIMLTCTSCGADNEYFVDEFKARNNIKHYLIILYMAIGVSFISFTLCHLFKDYYELIDYIVTILLVVSPFSIMLVYFKIDSSFQNDFNRTKLRGRNANTKLTSTSELTKIARVENSHGPADGIRKGKSTDLPSKRKEDRGEL